MSAPEQFNQIFCRNFDFDNGTPLEGRYSWEEAAPGDVPLPYLQVFGIRIPRISDIFQLRYKKATIFFKITKLM